MKLIRIRFLIITLEVPDIFEFRDKNDGKIITAKELENGTEVLFYGKALEITKNHSVPMFYHVPQLTAKIELLERNNKRLTMLLLISPIIYFGISRLIKWTIEQ